MSRCLGLLFLIISETMINVENAKFSQTLNHVKKPVVDFQNDFVNNTETEKFIKSEFNLSGNGAISSGFFTFLNTFRLLTPIKLNMTGKKNNSRNETISRKNPTPTEIFQNTAQLDSDGNYFLFWSYNDTDIIFEVHVRTFGYVGFGLSHFGGMFPGDIVIGGVKDGQSYFMDYHSTENDTPIPDSSQDWMLLHAEENNFGTVLKFTRLLETCDVHDRKIINDTNHIIFAYHSVDLNKRLSYHGVDKRGKKGLVLLGQQDIDLSLDFKTFYFTGNNETTIPVMETYYRCEIIEFPDLEQQHHFTGFYPVFQSNNEKYIHHMGLYGCNNLDYTYKGYTFLCHTDKFIMEQCSQMYAVSGVGSQNLEFPKHIGLSIGSPEDPKYLMLMVHYTTMQASGGITDASGFRAHYTSHLRQYTGGVFTTGVVPGQYSILPPYFQELVWFGMCSSQCLSQGMRNDTDTINVVGIAQHTHLHGRSVITRHIRDGVELQPLANETQYNFNAQGFDILENEISIKRGDVIRVECTYKSSSKNTFIFGGIGTSREMCNAYIIYYPKLVMDDCLGVPVYNGITKDTRKITRVLRKWNFSDTSIREKYQQELRESDYWSSCRVGKSMVRGVPSKIPFPKIEQEYITPVVECSGVR